MAGHHEIYKEKNVFFFHSYMHYISYNTNKMLAGIIYRTSEKTANEAMIRNLLKKRERERENEYSQMSPCNRFSEELKEETSCKRTLCIIYYKN